MTVNKKIYIPILIIANILCISACKNKNTVDQIETMSNKNTKIITCSNKGYEEMTVINENYIMVESEDDKYGIIDFEENYHINPEYDYGNVYSNDNLIILGQTANNYFKIIDFDLNVVFENTEYPDYKVKTISEGKVQLYSEVNKESIYLDSKNNFEEFLTLNDENVTDFETSTSFKNSHAIIISNFDTKNDNKSMVNTDGEFTSFDTVDKKIYTYLDFNANDDGWLLCYSIDNQSGESNKIFYNINTEEIKSLPDDKQYIEPIKDNDGLYYATSNNIALLKDDSEAKLLYIYDITNEKYLNETPFSYVELKDYGKEYILYCTASGNKWGYLNSNFELIDKVYQDATSYSQDGYAIVNEEGLEYLIDLEGNQISEAIEGDSAELNCNTFIITKNNMKYFTIISNR